MSWEHGFIMVPLKRPAHLVRCTGCRHLDAVSRTCRKTRESLSGSIDSPRRCERYSPPKRQVAEVPGGLRKGDAVAHGSLGEGVVRKFADGKVIVMFEGGLREFSHPTALQRGVLKKLDRSAALAANKTDKKKCGSEVRSSKDGNVSTRKGCRLEKRGSKLVCPKCGFSVPADAGVERCPTCKRGHRGLVRE